MRNPTQAQQITIDTTYAPNLDIDASTCQHPPTRHFAWFARDDTLPGGKAFCVGCCECGTVLYNGTMLGKHADKNPVVSPAIQRRLLDMVGELNSGHVERISFNPATSRGKVVVRRANGRSVYGYFINSETLTLRFLNRTRKLLPWELM